MTHPKKISRNKPALSRALANSAAAELRALPELRAAPLAGRALPDILLSSPLASPTAKLLSGLPASPRPLPRPPAPAVSAAERRERIARSAYRRAQSRGLGSTDPLEDWLLAEREVDALLAAPV